MTRPWAVRSGVRVPVLVNIIISRRVQMGSGVQRGCFKGIKGNEPKIDHSLPSRAETEGELCHGFNRPLCFHGT